MLTRNTPKTITTTVAIKGQGQSVEMEVVYFNRKLDEIQAVLSAARADERAKDDYEFASRETLLFLIKSWDAEYPLTNEGIKEAEADWPGLILGLGTKYHEARQVEVVKN